MSDLTTEHTESTEVMGEMGDQPFMQWAGRRVEWEMVHPELREIFAFGVHGPEICIEHNIHPMFPTSAEIGTVRRIINDLEEALA